MEKKKSIQFYNSFKEAQAAEDLFAARQDPLERLANTVRLIKMFYNYTPRPKGKRVLRIICK